MFTIAVIGRPNVGKSTLFNKLVGKKFAIVDDTPGVTRDRRQAVGMLGDLEFLVVDTAGLENDIADDALESRMLSQTQIAAMDANLVLMVVDGKVGVTSQDQHFANWLRKSNKEVVLLVNKCENSENIATAKEYYRLGFGAATAISAEHKQGFTELYDAIEPHFKKYQQEFGEFEVNEAEDEAKQMQIVVVGKPNAGKSTLLNNLLKEDRLITGPEAGITRDSIAIDWEFEKRPVRLIDTAGIRKKSNVSTNLEKMSLLDSFRSIRYAHTAILLIDASTVGLDYSFDKQDIAIANMIADEGRGLVIVFNKIDLIKNEKKFLKEVQIKLDQLDSSLSYAPIITCSALNKQNIAPIIRTAFKVYDQWNKKISTSKLNQWLEGAVSQHAPILVSGRPIRLKYVTQNKIRPPTFLIFTNHIKQLDASYRRYLMNSLRKVFNLDITPIRFNFKKSNNPYKK